MHLAKRLLRAFCCLYRRWCRIFHRPKLRAARGPCERAIQQKGTRCSGTWRRTALGAGRTTFECSTGLAGRGTFTYFDPTTGTATGRGRTNTGDRLYFWAGANVLDFIRSGSEDNRALLSCVTRALQGSGWRLLTGQNGCRNFPLVVPVDIDATAIRADNVAGVFRNLQPDPWMPQWSFAAITCHAKGIDDLCLGRVACHGAVLGSSSLVRGRYGPRS